MVAEVGLGGIAEDRNKLTKQQVRDLITPKCDFSQNKNGALTLIAPKLSYRVEPQRAFTVTGAPDPVQVPTEKPVEHLKALARGNRGFHIWRPDKDKRKSVDEEFQDRKLWYTAPDLNGAETLEGLKEQVKSLLNGRYGHLYSNGGIVKVEAEELDTEPFLLTTYNSYYNNQTYVKGYFFKGFTSANNYVVSWSGMAITPTILQDYDKYGIKTIIVNGKIYKIPAKGLWIEDESTGIWSFYDRQGNKTETIWSSNAVMCDDNFNIVTLNNDDDSWLDEYLKRLKTGEDLTVGENSTETPNLKDLAYLVSTFRGELSKAITINKDVIDKYLKEELGIYNLDSILDNKGVLTLDDVPRLFNYINNNTSIIPEELEKLVDTLQANLKINTKENEDLKRAVNVLKKRIEDISKVNQETPYDSSTDSVISSGTTEPTNTRPKINKETDDEQSSHQETKQPYKVHTLIPTTPVPPTINSNANALDLPFPKGQEQEITFPEEPDEDKEDKDFPNAAGECQDKQCSTLQEIEPNQPFRVEGKGAYVINVNVATAYIRVCSEAGAILYEGYPMLKPIYINHCTPFIITSTNKKTCFTVCKDLRFGTKLQDLTGKVSPNTQQLTLRDNFANTKTKIDLSPVTKKIEKRLEIVKDRVNLSTLQINNQFKSLENYINQKDRNNFEQLSNLINQTKKALNNEIEHLEERADDIEEKFTDRLDETDNALKEAKTELSNEISNTSTRLTNEISSTELKLTNQISIKSQELTNSIENSKNELKQQISGGKSDLENKINQANSNIETVKQGFENAKQGLETKISEAKSEFETKLNEQKQELRQDLNQAKEITKQYKQECETAKQDLERNIEEAKQANTTLQGNVEAFKAEFQEAKTETERQLQELKTQAPQQLLQAMNEVKTESEAKISQAVNNAKSELTTSLEQAKDSFGGQLEQAKQQREQIKAQIHSEVEQAKNILNTSINSTKQEITQYCETQKQAIERQIQNKSTELAQAINLAKQEASNKAIEITVGLQTKKQEIDQQIQQVTQQQQTARDSLKDELKEQLKTCKAELTRKIEEYKTECTQKTEQISNTIASNQSTLGRNIEQAKVELTQKIEEFKRSLEQTAESNKQECNSKFSNLEQQFNQDKQAKETKLTELTNTIAQNKSTLESTLNSVRQVSQEAKEKAQELAVELSSLTNTITSNESELQGLITANTNKYTELQQKLDGEVTRATDKETEINNTLQGIRPQITTNTKTINSHYTKFLEMRRKFNSEYLPKVKSAERLANQATQKANQATQKANQATQKANQATTKANQVETRLNQINDTLTQQLNEAKAKAEEASRLINEAKVSIPNEVRTLIPNVENRLQQVEQKVRSAENLASNIKQQQNIYESSVNQKLTEFLSKITALENEWQQYRNRYPFSID